MRWPGRPRPACRLSSSGCAAICTNGSARFFGDVAQRLAQAALRPHSAPDPRLAAELQAVLQHRHRAMTQSMVLAVNEQMDEAGREALARVSGVRQSTTAAPLLSLIAEDQIDEDIALAGIVQAVESECDGELRLLTGLCNGLSAREVFAIDVNPIDPGLCAKALRESLTPLGLSAPARVLMLRLASETLGRRLLNVYTGYIELLRSWRIKPSDVQLRTAAAASTSAAADAAPGHPRRAHVGPRDCPRWQGRGSGSSGPAGAGLSPASVSKPAAALPTSNATPARPEPAGTERSPRADCSAVHRIGRQPGVIEQRRLRAGRAQELARPAGGAGAPSVRCGPCAGPAAARG